MVNIEDFNKLNNELSQFNLDCFQHRLIKRIARFVHKIFKNQFTPTELKMSLSKNSEHKQINYDLRNKNMFVLPSKGRYNDHMESTYTYFYSKFLNEFLLKDIQLEPSHFHRRVDNNINLYFIKFTRLFVKFDLNFRQFGY